MNTRRRLLLSILLLPFVAATPARGAQSPRVVGMIASLTGPVYLRPGPRADEIMLDPRRDASRVLEEGQAIRCGPGGRATIRLADRLEQLTATRGRFELRYPTGLSPAERELLAALAAYGRPGGTRGLGARVYAPADQGVVQLDRLNVRWNDVNADTITVALADASRREIWSTTARGRDGRLSDAGVAALRTALRQAARAGDAWTISLRGPAGGLGASTFHVLDAAASRTLATRLQGVESQPDSVLQAIARAYVFGDLSLLNDAAEEFERLLPSMPDSVPLLRAAIAAHDRTGNLTRAQALRARLPPEAR